MSKVDIHPSAQLGDHVDIMGSLTLGANVQVGANVTFYPDVHIGAGTIILAGAVIGRPPIAAGQLTRPLTVNNKTVHIGENCVIGSNAVLYCDLVCGESVLIGDLATVREGCRLGDQVVLGRRSTLLYNVTVGSRTRVHDGVHLTGNMVVEADVFFGPLSVASNDNEVYLRRYKLLPMELSPPVVRRFALIGTNATLAAGIEVGMGAIVAPSAMATRDVPAWTVVAGIPARTMRDVPDEDRLQILRKFGLADEDSA
ncbi:MAG: DapH/DapD/GlmU-related protein [Chloroflexi bacterium]|nr:DapH/DapD/GlmU-related protein [Chloroflexota bacterium]